jgi:DNA-binding transcriptional LysR family regulator
MDFRQLEAFYWVARLGGFGVASSHLSISQPAVSKRVRQLEESLGVRLFYGNTRNMRLTVRGRALEVYAARAIGLMNEIRSKVGNPADISGQLNIGAADMIALTWMPKLMRLVRERHPNLNLVLYAELSHSLRERIRRRSLDVAFLFGPFQGSDLVGTRIGHLALSWVGSPRLGLPEGRLTPQDVAEFPIISWERYSDLHNLMSAWFRRGNAVPAHVIHCNAQHLLVELAAEGLGLTILPPAMLQAELAGGKLATIDTDPPLAPANVDGVYPADAEHQSVVAEIIRLGVACAAEDDSFGPTTGIERA